jgi:hypothetical protein
MCCAIPDWNCSYWKLHSYDKLDYHAKPRCSEETCDTGEKASGQETTGCKQ